MKTEIDWNLIARHLSGENSAEEEAALKSWLAANPDRQEEMKLIERIWSSPEKEHRISNLESAWNRLAAKTDISLPFKQIPSNIHRISERKIDVELPTRQRAYPYLRYAAVVLLCISLPVLYFLLRNSLREIAVTDWEKQVVANGQQLSLLLSDGTTVHLDAGSELSYPKQFTGATREVHLKGEAYIEVAHGAQKPFIVRAGSAVVKVLGTKFNVQAWDEMKEVRVAVLDGRVAFRSEKQNDESAVVIPKGKMSLLKEKNTEATAPITVDTRVYIAWMERELILNNTPLHEVVQKLQRWYDVKIELPGSVYNSTRITGHFKNRSVEGILEEVGLMIHLNVHRVGKNVVFSKERPSK